MFGFIRNLTIKKNMSLLILNAYQIKKIMIFGFFVECHINLPGLFNAKNSSLKDGIGTIYSIASGYEVVYTISNGIRPKVNTKCTRIRTRLF